MEPDGWIAVFFGKQYDTAIPARLACHAAQYIESKQLERKNAWFQKIFPSQLLELYKKGAEYGDPDCIDRLNEHRKNQAESVRASGR